VVGGIRPDAVGQGVEQISAEKYRKMTPADRLRAQREGKVNWLPGNQR
jgi:hypothetical protein